MNKGSHLGFKSSFVHLKAQLPKARGFIWIMFIQSLLIMIGFVFFIIPGVLMAIWWSQSLFVYLKEGKRGMAALERSYELMRGYGWYYFYMLIPVVFVILAIIVPSILVIFLLPISYLVLILAATPLMWVYYYHLFERIVRLNQQSARSMIAAKYKWSLVGAFVLYYVILLGSVGLSSALWGSVLETKDSIGNDGSDSFNFDTWDTDDLYNPSETSDNELSEEELAEIEAWLEEIEGMSDEEFQEYLNSLER